MGRFEYASIIGLETDAAAAAASIVGPRLSQYKFEQTTNSVGFWKHFYTELVTSEWKRKKRRHFFPFYAEENVEKLRLRLLAQTWEIVKKEKTRKMLSHKFLLFDK